MISDTTRSIYSPTTPLKFSLNLTPRRYAPCLSPILNFLAGAENLCFSARVAAAREIATRFPDRSLARSGLSESAVNGSDIKLRTPRCADAPRDLDFLTY